MGPCLQGSGLRAACISTTMPGPLVSCSRHRTHRFSQLDIQLLARTYQQQKRAQKLAWQHSRCLSRCHASHQGRISSPSPGRTPSPSPAPGGTGGGGSSPTDTILSDDDDDDGSSHPGLHLNPFVLLVLAYAGFLGWVALCAAGMDQYQDKHVHTMPGADKWDVSIIIPVINEEKPLGETLDWLRENLVGIEKVEIVVVDGGSEDKTVRAAWNHGADRVVRSSRQGWAALMNSGASHASGEVLAFMPADTVPPAELVSVVRQELSDPRSVLLGFKCRIQGSDDSLMRHMTAHHNLKTWLYPLLLRPLEYLTGLRLLSEYQVLCCRKTDFEAVGGFKDSLPIMEDEDLCRRMHAHGPAPQHVRARHTKLAVKGRIHGRIKVITDHESVTSGTRNEQWGDMYGAWAHFRTAMAWFAGASGEELGRLHDRLYSTGVSGTAT